MIESGRDQTQKQPGWPGVLDAGHGPDLSAVCASPSSTVRWPTAPWLSARLRCLEHPLGRSQFASLDPTARLAARCPVRPALPVRP